MNTFIDCIPCFVKQAVTSLDKACCDDKEREKALRDVLLEMSKIDFCTSPPVMSQQIHGVIKKISGGADLYAEDKRMLNEYGLSLVPEMKKLVERNPQSRFENLIRLAIAGNIMDLGVFKELHKSDVVECIGRCMQAKIDKNAVSALREAVENAQNILYLGDNAGEIVFDRLLIENLPCEKITYVVRGAPVINDVTLADACQVEMVNLVNVLDNGSNAPGTILSDCSPKFRKEFEMADLIIAKGQGNYETLSSEDKNICFLLQAKCPVIARDIGCETGSFIIEIRKSSHCSPNRLKLMQGA